MDRLLSYLNRLDWLFAAVLFVLAAWYQNPWLALSGCVSVATAWYNPSKRVRTWLEAKMLASPKRRQALAERAAAVRIEQEEQAYAASSTPDAKLDFSVRIGGYGPLQVRASKHNRLFAGAGNLLNAKDMPTWH